MDSASAALPPGVIVMWSGSLEDIPDGWLLCDGENGTPDLRNRFVLGTGNPEYLGSTGGSREHRHRVREHAHQVDPPPFRGRSAYSYFGGHGGGVRNRYYMLPEQTLNIRPFRSAPAQVVSDSVSQLPPFFKIAFIMKR